MMMIDGVFDDIYACHHFLITHQIQHLPSSSTTILALIVDRLVPVQVYVSHNSNLMIDTPYYQLKFMDNIKTEVSPNTLM
jgi:hypothetical protein